MGKKLDIIKEAIRTESTAPKRTYKDEEDRLNAWADKLDGMGAQQAVARFPGVKNPQHAIRAHRNQINDLRNQAWEARRKHLAGHIIEATEEDQNSQEISKNEWYQAKKTIHGKNRSVLRKVGINGPGQSLKGWVGIVAHKGKQVNVAKLRSQVGWTADQFRKNRLAGKVETAESTDWENRGKFQVYAGTGPGMQAVGKPHYTHDEAHAYAKMVKASTGSPHRGRLLTIHDTGTGAIHGMSGRILGYTKV